MIRSTRTILAAAFAGLLLLAGAGWMAWNSSGRFVTGHRGGAGLAPPTEGREHGTVPEGEIDPDQSHEGKVPATTLPADAVVARTNTNWPNVRVDNLQVAPEETAIVIDPTDPNRIIAAAQGIGCYYYRSTDGGSTWTGASLNDPYDLGDPALAIARDGTAYYGYLGTFQHSGIYLGRSVDGGASWRQGVAVLDHNAGAPFEDKEWATVDWTNGSFAGSVYVAWTQFDAYGSSNPTDSTRILFSYSRNRGDTFAVPVRISDHGGDCVDVGNTVEGAVPAVGPDGAISLAWAGPRGIEFDRSTNGGRTWGVDRVIAAQPGGWDFPVEGIFRANGLPTTKVDFSGGAYSGRLYVLWSDPRHGDVDVFLIHSTDNGLTWSAPVRVNGDPVGNGRDQFFPWIDVDPVTGAVYVVYYDRRATTGVDTEVWLATSQDGGATFSEECVSQSPFTPDPAVFFGDYIGVAAYGGRVRPFWMRLDGQQLSVWTALVEHNPANVCDTAGGRLTMVPNPTRTGAAIYACGALTGAGSVQVFSADGRLVRSLATVAMPETGPLASWDLRDDAGRRVPPGVFLVRTPGGAASRLVVTR
jgi:hypothetical protein